MIEFEHYQWGANRRVMDERLVSLHQFTMIRGRLVGRKRSRNS